MEMRVDEQVSGWKKATNSMQQDGRKEMLTDEQASSWRKTLALAQVKNQNSVLQGKKEPK